MEESGDREAGLSEITNPPETLKMDSDELTETQVDSESQETTELTQVDAVDEQSSGPLEPSQAAASGTVPPAAAVATTLPEERPNFTGNWMLIRAEGDLDGYFKEMGVGFMFRKLLKAYDYGVNRKTYRILHQGGVLQMASAEFHGEVVSQVRTDGSEQEAVDPSDGKMVRVTPTWEGKVLVLTGRKIERNTELPITKRFMVGTEMCVEQISPRGISVRWFFVRRPLNA